MCLRLTLRFNVCIMAYGQTGSGKTHTMLGQISADGVPDMTGVIPCAVNEVGLRNLKTVGIVISESMFNPFLWCLV
jgi:hypothetical protein